MERRHLQETDTGYRVFLYIFYACAFMMASITAYGAYAMYTEWEENGIYVMGEVLVTTEIPSSACARPKASLRRFDGRTKTSAAA